MNIGRIFAHAVVRRIAYLVVAAALVVLGSVFGTGEAKAQAANACPSNDPCPDIQTAYAACQAWGEAVLDTKINSSGNRHWEWKIECERRGTSGNPYIYGQIGSITAQDRQAGSFYYLNECPAGTEWRPDLGGRCFDPDECLQRNGASNGFPATESVRPFAEKCLDGCQFKPQGPHSCSTFSGETWCSGVYQFSGNVCTPPSSPPPEPPEPPPGDDGCKTGETSGITMCKKPDGRECYSSGGAQICWNPGETGQKATGPEAHTRGPGPTEPTPEPPTPPETFDPAEKKGPETTNTSTNNGSGGGSNSTTTIVINNTVHGTNAPGKPPGSGGGGDSDDGEDEGTASGGGDCATPPETTGDAVMGMVARQTWETRCALEKIREGSVVTGDVGDCNSPFTVEGNDANAQRLRAMREQICPGGAAAAAGDGNDIDWSDLAGPDSAAGTAFFGEDVVVGEDGLDMSGLGFSRTCPVIPPVDVFGQTIQFDNSVMCSWLELGGTILLILSALVSVRIMAGVGT